MNKNSEYLKVFSECLPVRGYRRALIYDLARNDKRFIPLGLYDILQNFTNKSLTSLINSFPDEQEIIKEYLSFLQKHDYIFYCDSNELDLFNSMKLDWQEPALLSTGIIEIHNINLDYYNQIFNFLLAAGCKQLVFYLDDSINVSLIKSLLSLLEASRIQSIDIVMSSSSSNLDDFNQLAAVKRLNKILITQATENNYNLATKQLRLKDDFRFEKFRTSENSFIINLSFFTESRSHNSYFNQKIFFAKNGDIKNSFETSTVFANVNKIKSYEALKTLVSSSEFQKQWHYNKDKCDVCKECEFRYMCLDNRELNERVDGSLYHKEECNYNPFICKWEGEEGYLNLEQCGVISNDSGCSIDNDKIDTINSKLWK
jgi:SPASM domain peptide maturase of grasp-with-spasm system